MGAVIETLGDIFACIIDMVFARKSDKRGRRKGEHHGHKN